MTNNNTTVSIANDTINTQIPPISSRFWSKSIQGVGDPSLSDMLHMGENSIQQIDTGFAIYRSTLIPIHNGKYQQQHTSQLPARDDMTICGFLPRAGQV